MIKKVTFVPFQGMLPLTLGMSMGEAATTLGTPKMDTTTWDDMPIQYWDPLIAVLYDENRLAAEIQIGRDILVMYEGSNLFGRRDIRAWLKSLDSSAYETVGVLVCPAIGLAVSGFETDGDLADRTLTAFRKGTRDQPPAP